MPDPVKQNPLDIQSIKDHKTGLHRSDRVVTEIMTSRNGFKFEVTHCIDCGCMMTKPLRKEQP